VTTPAPELIGNLHSDSYLRRTENKKAVTVLPHEANAAGTILPLRNMYNLCHGFSAGKQLVASYLRCMNCKTLSVYSVCIIMQPLHPKSCSSKGTNTPHSVF